MQEIFSHTVTNRPIIASMKANWLRSIVLMSVCLIASVRSPAQGGTDSGKPAATTAALPVTTQVEKTVVFIETDLPA